MSWYKVPIEVFPKLRNTHGEDIIILFFIIIFFVLAGIIILYGIRNYLRIIKIKKNKIPFDEKPWILIDAKPVWTDPENGSKTIVGREGIVETMGQKIYKQQEIKTFASEEDFQMYISEYKTHNKKIYIRIDQKNPNLYYIDFPEQQMVTGMGNITKEGMLFLTRIKNIFCRPTSQDIIVLPVLLLLTLGILHIVTCLIFLSELLYKEIGFVCFIWLWGSILKFGNWGW